MFFIPIVLTYSALPLICKNLKHHISKSYENKNVEFAALVDMYLSCENHKFGLGNEILISSFFFYEFSGNPPILKRRIKNPHTVTVLIHII